MFLVKNVNCLRTKSVCTEEIAIISSSSIHFAFAIQGIKVFRNHTAANDTGLLYYVNGKWSEQNRFLLSNIDTNIFMLHVIINFLFRITLYVSEFQIILFSYDNILFIGDSNISLLIVKN